MLGVPPVTCTLSGGPAPIGPTLAAGGGPCRLATVPRGATGMIGHTRQGAMANSRDPTTDPSRPLVYQIRVRGQLGRQWTDWFGGLTVTPEDNGDTLLTGPVVDQAALHGLLRRVRDLGLPLLSVIRLEPGYAEVSAGQE